MLTKHVTLLLYTRGWERERENVCLCVMGGRGGKCMGDKMECVTLAVGCNILIFL